MKIRDNVDRFIKENKIDQNWLLYILFIPVFIYYLIFSYIPMYGATLAFKKSFM